MIKFHIQCGEDGSMSAAATDILKSGHSFGASDIHLEPYGEHYRLRFRIDGLFEDYSLAHLREEHITTLIGRYKVMAKKKSYLSQVVQEGRVEWDGLQARVSFFPTIAGEKVVLRFLSRSQKYEKMSQLGFLPDDLTVLEDVLAKPSGLFLIAGPSNSGKTTAAYACLRKLQEERGERISVATLEDPVEWNIPTLCQTDLSMGACEIEHDEALKALLRQDPEVIFIGEIRDEKTATVALQASLTGHLIITTIHAGSFAEAVTRLSSFSLSSQQIFSSLQGYLGLSLVRSLCGFCSAKGKNAGCEKCRQSGFLGRTTVYELSVLSDETRQEMVCNRKSFWEIEPELRIRTKKEIVEFKRAQGILHPSEVLGGVS